MDKGGLVFGGLGLTPINRLDALIRQSILVETGFLFRWIFRTELSKALMAQLVTRTEVLSSYRYLLRSLAIAFQGDNVTLIAAKKEARNRFETGRKLNVDAP